MATISDLTTEVRIALNMNKVDEGLEGIGDEETLKLDELIASKIADGVRYVCRHAPLSMLNGYVKEPYLEQNIVLYRGNTVVDGTLKDGETLRGIYTPQNKILRVVSFWMTDWDYPVSNFITPESPEYAKQFSKYGVKGNPERPVAALINNDTTYSGSQIPYIKIEFFTSGSRNADVYVIPDFSVEQGGKVIPNLEGDAYKMAVSYIAYLTALSLGDDSMAGRMLAQYSSLSSEE